MRSDDSDGLISMFKSDPYIDYLKEVRRKRKNTGGKKSGQDGRSKNSKIGVIQKYLEQGNKIDVYKCFELTGSVALAVHISGLRSKGLNILSARKEGDNIHEYWISED